MRLRQRVKNTRFTIINPDWTTLRLVIKYMRDADGYKTLDREWIYFQHISVLSLKPDAAFQHALKQNKYDTNNSAKTKIW